jgi:hypothetical protein
VLESHADVSRRNLLAGTVGSALGALLLSADSASAIGPVNVNLVDPTYEAVVCPKIFQDEIDYEKLDGVGVQVKMGGGKEKAIADTTKQCIRVRATVTNPTKSPLPNFAIYGFVNDAEAGVTVVGNSLRNDKDKAHAGQIAKINSIPVGTSTVEFTFIATIAKSYGGRLPRLSFESLKGTSSPGGKVLQAFGPCDMDPMSDECEESQNE